MANLLEASGLACTFPGGTRAVAGLDLVLESGDLVGLIGPDGAGKTTTFRMLVGLQKPTGGHLEWQIPRAAMGYVPQAFALPPDLTVRENLQLQARLYGLAPSGTELESLLARVDLDRFQDRLAGALSGGMKQKLALCVALLPRPALLLLDEPTTGVDPVSRREFWELLHQVHGEGVAILFSTPYMDEAEYAHRMLLMHGGRILAAGREEDFRATLGGVVVVLTSANRRNLEAKVAALAPLDCFGEGEQVRARFHEQPLEPLLERLRSLEGVDSVRATEATIEDAFLHALTPEATHG